MLCVEIVHPCQKTMIYSSNSSLTVNHYFDFFFFQILLGSLCCPLSIVPQLQATCTADVHHS